MNAIISIELGQIDTGDLIDELEHRKVPITSIITDMRVGGIIAKLNTHGCPQSIIEQLETWNRQPIADALKLKEWIESYVLAQS